MRAYIQRLSPYECSGYDAHKIVLSNRVAFLQAQGSITDGSISRDVSLVWMRLQRRNTGFPPFHVCLQQRLPKFASLAKYFIDTAKHQFVLQYKPQGLVVKRFVISLFYLEMEWSSTSIMSCVGLQICMLNQRICESSAVFAQPRRHESSLGGRSVYQVYASVS